MRILTIAACTLITAASAQARLFEDQYGRIIDAELVSHTGPSASEVTIAKGGKQMVAKIALFSMADQEYIRSWMKETAPTVNYGFRVASKGTSASTTGGSSKSAEKFELQITSLTRVPVEGLTAQYRLYYRDYPTTMSDIGDMFRKRAGLGGKARRAFRRDVEPSLKFVEDKAPIESRVEFNQTVTVETKPLTLHSGKNPFSGDRYSDEFVGFIVRILDATGKVVFEHRDPKATDFEWESDSANAISS